MVGTVVREHEVISQRKAHGRSVPRPRHVLGLVIWHEVGLKVRLSGFYDGSLPLADRRRGNSGLRDCGGVSLLELRVVVRTARYSLYRLPQPILA